jgi:hypothetical protein
MAAPPDLPTQVEAPGEPHPARRRSLWLLSAVAGVALGLVAGSIWWRGSDEPSAVVTRNGAAPTERELEMVDIAERYAAAWTSNDGDAAASYMTPDAVFTHADLGDEYTVDDGSLQALVSGTPVYRSMRFDEPVLVDGDRLVLLGRVDAMDLDFVSVIRFTTDDPPLIASEVVYFVS